LISNLCILVLYIVCNLNYTYLQVPNFIRLLEINYKNHMNETEPQYFTKFRLELNEKLDKRFDAHAEQIAYVSEEITVMKKDIIGIKGEIVGIKGEMVVMKGEIVGIKGEIKGIKEELVGVNERLDGHAEQIAHVSEQNSEIIRSMSKKEDTLYLDDLSVRTKKLEKVVFA